MVLDRKHGRVVISELATGRLVALETRWATLTQDLRLLSKRSGSENQKTSQAGCVLSTLCAPSAVGCFCSRARLVRATSHPHRVRGASWQGAGRLPSCSKALNLSSDSDDRPPGLLLAGGFQPRRLRRPQQMPAVVAWLAAVGWRIVILQFYNKYEDHDHTQSFRGTSRKLVTIKNSASFVTKKISENCLILGSLAFIVNRMVKCFEN